MTHPPSQHYSDSTVSLHHGDCLDVLRSLPDASVDAVVTDPPYGLEFMGKEWDGADGFRRSLNPNDAGRNNAFGRTSRTSPEYRTDSAFQEWCEAWSRECLRVLKPGGHMLAFGGTRTWHRMAVAIDDAGFEIRDSIAWMYGSGFPKSLDVSKAIDRHLGAERQITGTRPGAANGSVVGLGSAPSMGTEVPISDPVTAAAAAAAGWGTALKPAFEPIVVARKPLSGTVAANVLAHGTGALNVDGCRVGTTEALQGSTVRNDIRGGNFASGHRANPGDIADYAQNPAGRWPANVILDESQAEELDAQSGEQASRRIEKPAEPTPNHRETYNGANDGSMGGARPARGHTDTGGASRFFYVAKADASERVRVNGVAHPTVKPLSLMRWLVRLVTPPGGTVLEPFAGSGTTVEACILEGFRCVAIEREADYLPLIRQRINRRRDPVAAVKATGDDGGLFDLLDEETA